MRHLFDCLFVAKFDEQTQLDDSQMSTGESPAETVRTPVDVPRYVKAIIGPTIGSAYEKKNNLDKADMNTCVLRMNVLKEEQLR